MSNTAATYHTQSAPESWATESYTVRHPRTPSHVRHCRRCRPHRPARQLHHRRQRRFSAPRSRAIRAGCTRVPRGSGADADQHRGAGCRGGRVTTLASILIEQAAAQPGVAALQSLAAWLPTAALYRLDQPDLARIDSYAGSGRDLHDLLPAVLPLAQPVWYEAGITAQHGTRMVIGYGATPNGLGGINIWQATYAPDHGRIIGPLGPLLMDGLGMGDAPDTESARLLRSAAGIVARALLLRVGSLMEPA